MIPSTDEAVTSLHATLETRWPRVRLDCDGPAASDAITHSCDAMGALVPVCAHLWAAITRDTPIPLTVVHLSRGTVTCLACALAGPVPERHCCDWCAAAPLLLYATVAVAGPVLIAGVACQACLGILAGKESHDA